MRKNSKSKIRLFNIVAIITILLGNLAPASLALADSIEIGKQNISEELVDNEKMETPSFENDSSVDEGTKTEPEVEEVSEVKDNKEVDEKNKKEVPKSLNGAKKEEKKAELQETKKEMKTITILGTSDVHGNVWDYSYEDDKTKPLGFASISTIVNNVRTEKGGKDNVLLLDAGDNLQGTIMTDDLYSVNKELSANHPVVKAMNYIGYDAMALGNHEFNFGLDLIKSANSQAKFPYLSANTRYKDTNEYLVGHYTMVKKDDINIAVIGMTIPHIHKWDAENAKDLKFESLRKEAKNQVKLIKEKNPETDLIVTAIHAGIENEDPEAAGINVIKEVPEIDAFVLGHDHRAFAEHHEDNEGTKKPVGAVKDTGANVLRIDLEIEKEVEPENDKATEIEREVTETTENIASSKKEEKNGWKVKDSKVQLLNASDVKGDEGLKAETQYAHEKTLAYTQEVIGQASADFLPEEKIPGIPEAQLRPTAMISLINNVQREKTGAQIAAGSLFKEDSRLNKGDIRFNNLFDIYKYANTLVKTKITGANLKKYMEQQAGYYNQFKKGDVAIGFNEKTRIYDYDMFSGVTYKIDISKPTGSRIIDLKLADGTAIKDNEEYTLAVNSHRFGGLVNNKLVNEKDKEDSDPDSLRGYIAEYIRAQGTIDPTKELEESFEVIGYDFDEDYRKAVIEEVKKGNVEVVHSADGRTPNVKTLNIYELIAEGKIDESILKDEEKQSDLSFTILHTNDMHGRLGYEEGKSIGMAKLKTYKDQVKPTFMLDGGDAMQGLAISNYSEGMDMVKAMNTVPYDAMAVGNHEFDFGYERAMTYQKDLQFPMLAANVSKNGEASFQANKIIEKDGKKYGLIGLSTPETAFKTHPKNVKDVVFKDPIPVAKESMKELEGKVDAYIFLTHLGIDKTTPEKWRSDTLATELAKDYADKRIVIIDGHSHSAIPEGQAYGKNLILAQTGNYLNNVGLVEVAFTNTGAQLNAKLVPASEFKDVAEDPTIKAIVDQAKVEFNKEMGQTVIADNPVFFNGDGAYNRTRETNLGNIIGDAMYNYGQTGFHKPTDLAVVNGGGIRVDVNKGKVTKGDILAVLPFGNTIAQVEVTGSQLYEMFEHSLRSEAQKDKDGNVVLDEKGLPMLGRNGGYLQVSDSVKISYDSNKQGAVPESKVSGERVLEIEIKNRISGKFESVVKDRVYNLATNDFLAAGGDGYTMLGGAREEGPSLDAVFTEFLQDVVGETKAMSLKKIVPITEKKYALENYKEEFPYSRIIPVKEEDFNSGKPTNELAFTIMHTNDMHGRFEYDKGGKAIGLAKVKTYKDEKKPTLLVDAGDAIQGLPISNHTKGADMVKAMNAVGYDAMTLGNHEFDFGMERALTLKDELNFPIVSANVYKDGMRPFDPYVLKEKEGVRFALIGLTTPETTVKTHPNNVKGVTFKKPVPVAKEVINEIDGKADVFVFMTHLGIDETTVQDERGDNLARELSATYPDKKIFIIDGHSHTALPHGKQEGHVLMGQTGNHLNNIGWIDAKYNPAAALSAQLISFADFETLNIEQDPTVKAIADEARANYDKAMGEIVLTNNPVHFDGERVNVRARETNLGNLIGDALYDYGQTGFEQPSDFSVVNGGGIRQDINKGEVTKGEIVGVMPFGNIISQIQISGQQIYDMFEHSLRSIPAKDEDGNIVIDENGLPALGANGGFLQISDSIRVKYDSNKPGRDLVAGTPGQRVLKVEIKDKVTGTFVDVDKAKTDYHVTTNDFLAAGGDGFDMFGGARQEGPSMDTVFLDYLQARTSEELLAYEKEFPYSRIVPITEADFNAEQQPGTDADKTLLQAEVDKAKKLVNEDYTPASWQVVEEALVEAEGVLTNTSATKVEITDALNRLKAAQNALVPAGKEVNTALLQAAVKEAEKLKEADYTAPTWKLFADALKQANVVLANTSATQLEVDEALTALETAQVKLEKVSGEQKVDFTKLKEAVAVAEKLKEADYTAPTWKLFADALKQANVVLANTSATQIEVETAMNSLQAAQRKLVKVPSKPGEQKVDFSKLHSAIAEAEKKQEKVYTFASWQPFAEALANAKAIATKDKAKLAYASRVADPSQADVDNATNALMKTMTELQPIALSGGKIENNITNNTNNNTNSRRTNASTGLPQTGEKESTIATVGLIVVLGVSSIVYIQKKRSKVA